MPKLYFRYGAMNAGKTTQLLGAAYNYESLGRQVLVIKPQIDTRFEKDSVTSRSGKTRMCTTINEKMDLCSLDLTDIACIFVDECQFLTPEQIDQLRQITELIPVICYGLRTDYKTRLFPGAQRLMELADSIEEIKTVCVVCPKKAIINAKKCGDKITVDGNSEPDIGAEEKYQAMCWSCYNYALIKRDE